MKTSEDLKTLVKEKYGAIAEQSRDQNAGSCCGALGCGTVEYSVFAEDYAKLPGYAPDADLGLGCGLPTEFAHIKPGDTVLDLGSGAGNDCFVARAIAGETGKVIGVDMTEVMVEKARANAEKLGFNNVEFRLGDIEHLPVAANRVDVVVSNCVLNLVPDKSRALAETFRVLKPGGHFSISDVVLAGELPEAFKQDAELYAGCVAGALQRDDYLERIRAAGFANVQVQKQRRIDLPADLVSRYMDADAYAAAQVGIYSITVYAEKPTACCGPDCCN